jgi:hypothetical protein
VSTPAWSRALADLVGAPLQVIDAERVRAWVSDGLRESEQLDFKAELYGNGDSQRRELAGDLAAFANHRGGVLILGVAETELGAAASLPAVELTDAEQRRIHQIVAGNVFPHLPIEIFPIATEADGRGAMIIAVARSPLRPHAVAVNDGLRYPRRQGAVTRYLSESEVADLYRDRFAVQRNEVERVSAIRREAIAEVDQDGAVWVAVSSVPTGAGSLMLSDQTIANTQAWAQRFIGNDYVAGFLGQAAPLVRPGLRRVRLLTQYAHNSLPNYQYAELHTDGAGVATHRLFTGRDAPADGEPLPVLNMALLWTAAQALNVVARHALNVGAWGEVLVELTVFGPPRVLAWIAHGQFIERITGARILDDDVISKHTFALSDLTAGTQPLLAATRLLLMDIFNAFGASEIRALTQTGALRADYIGGAPELRAWAMHYDVSIE